MWYFQTKKSLEFFIAACESKKKNASFGEGKQNPIFENVCFLPYICFIGVRFIYTQKCKTVPLSVYYYPLQFLCNYKEKVAIAIAALAYFFFTVAWIDTTTWTVFNSRSLQCSSVFEKKKFQWWIKSDSRYSHSCMQALQNENR